MTPQNGVQDYSSRPLPPEIVVLILFFGCLVIGAFVFAMSTFLRAGKRDAIERRSRGVAAKDPLDPQTPESGNPGLPNPEPRDSQSGD